MMTTLLYRGQNYVQHKEQKAQKDCVELTYRANETSFLCKIVVGIARDVSCTFRQRKLCVRVQKPLLVDSLRCFINLVSALTAP
jgi:hypothetical protein